MKSEPNHVDENVSNTGEISFEEQKQKPKTKISIWWKIFASFIVFTVVVLCLLWILQIALLNNFYQAIKESEIQPAMNAVVIDSNKDINTLNETLSGIANQNQISVLVSDKDGNILVGIKATPNNIFEGKTQADFVQLYQNTASHDNSLYKKYPITKIDANGKPIPSGETVLYTRIVTTSNGQQILIMVNSTITPVDSTVKTLQFQLICITIIMILLAIGLAFFLARNISKPIVKINKSAKVLGEGKYDVYFPEDGYKEIAELATTLNYAAHELSKVEQLQRDLIANISHDLRTPLTMITGYSEVMRDLPNENTPENVQIIIDEAKRLTTLVNDVLDISKLQSGALPFESVNFNLTDSIRTILDRYEKLLDGYTIQFEENENVWVNGDELKLSQVVYNLVNNAITYTGSDKTVIIRQTIMELPGFIPNRVRIEIIDSGEGIPQDQLTDIWNRYYKVDKTHIRAAVGTGLGLHIVKTILDLHPGASYGVKSTIGEGSVFWFELNIKNVNT